MALKRVATSVLLDSEDDAEIRALVVAHDLSLCKVLRRLLRYGLLAARKDPVGVLCPSMAEQGRAS